MPDGSSGTRHLKTKVSSKRRRRTSIGLMALEPRLMYDGAGAASAAAAAHHHHNDHHADAGAHNHAQPEHVAPAVTTGTPPATFVGGGSAATLDSGLTLSGGDRGGNLASATVSISSGYTSGDTLNFTNQNGITGSYNSSTGVLTLSGTSSVANYQTALESITYSSTATDPTNGGADTSRTISWVASDGSHHNGTSSTATSTVDVFAPPQLTAGATKTYTSGDAAVTLDRGLTLTDPSGTLASATVAITSGFLSGDTLSFTNQNGISGSYNSSTGVLTLSGTASVAAYQAALASVTFGSSASDATQGGANLDRTIVWTTNDGANQATATSNVAVAAGMLPGSQQIVFIDSNVPDAQALAAGVQPGITVVILDPNANGVQEIADYLTENNVQNLAAIQIVSHGEDATVRLGNTIFGLADISMFSQQLATWGQALQPGGDILFYGCNVGEGTAGALFEIEVSQATGGAHVAASSGLVGAASLGGSWTLDIADGTIDVGNPFTATTLATYDNILTNKIWFTEHVTGNTADDQVGTIIANGTNQTGSSTSVFNAAGSSNYNFQGIAIDAADGLYFVVNNDTAQVLRGSISGGTLTAIYSAPNTNKAAAGGVDDFLNGLVYNPVTHSLYFTVEDANANNGGSADTGIFVISNPTVASPTATKLIAASSTGAVAPFDLAVDATDNLLFFSDFSNFGGGGAANSTTARLEVANLSTGTILNNALETINTNNTLQLFYGIDVDPTNHKLYWTVNDPSTSDPVSNNAVFSATYSTGATPTLSSVTALYTATTHNFTPEDITVDVADGVYYAAFGANNVPPATASGEIVEGSLSAVNNNPTVVFTVPSPASPDFGQPNFVEFEAAPVLSVTGASPTAVEGGSAVALASAVTVTDLDQNIPSATVTINSHQTGDTLAATTTGTNITASYNSTTGVLTLSGVDTPAHYQTVLDSVTFATTSGASTSRTFSWSTTDGNLASNTAPTSATVRVPPVITPGSPSVTFLSGGSAVVLDSGLAISDTSSSNLASATVSITGGFLAGDTLSFTNTNSTTEGNVAVQSYNSSTGVLTLTGSATLAQWATALQNVTYSFSGDPTHAGADTSRTVSWQVSDGTLSSASASTTLQVRTAPSITAGASVTFTAGGSAVVVDSGLALTGTESSSFSGAKITISSGFLAGDTLAATTTGTSITATYNSSTGVLTLSGSDTLAHYRTVLQSITFTDNGSNITASGSDHTRTLSWQITDNLTVTSSPATSTVTVNDPPVVTPSGTVPSFTGGGAAVVLNGGITLSDREATSLTSATVSITGGFLSGDMLNFATQNGITGSYNSSTGVLTLTGSSSLANYRLALASITYSFPGGSDPTGGGSDASRTISWQVNDGNTNSATTTSTLTTVHTAPAVTAGAAVTFTGGGNAVTLDSALSLTNIDSTALVSATVSITGGTFVPGLDVLSVNLPQTSGTITGTNISVSFNSSTGVLTLSGSDSFANYRNALDNVQYNVSSANADPTNGGSQTSRTISWSVKDNNTSNNTSTAATSSLTVVHTPPSLMVAGGGSYAAGGSPTFLLSGITISDSDSGGNLTGATISITSGFTGGDLLNFTPQSGITVQSYVNGVLTLTGTTSIANYAAALQTITFSSGASDPTNGGTDTNRTITWQVKDAASTSGGTNLVSLSVTAGPSITAGVPSVTYFAAGSPATLDPGLTISDGSITTLTGATVSITGNFVAGDTLAASVTGTSIAASYNTATGVLTLSGSDTLAHYQQVLDNVTYSSTAADPTGAGTKFTRTISWSASDSGSTGTAVTTSVGVRTPPVVTPGSPSVTFTAGGGAVPLDTVLTLTDAETGTLTGAQVAITGGLQGGDILNFTNQGGITGVYSNGVLTLSGTASVSAYQTALQSITFSTSGTDITSGGTDHTRTVTWSVSDNQNAGSNGSTSTVTVIDPPVVTPTGVTPTYNAGGSSVILASGLTLTDRESTQLTSVTVTIGGFQAGDTLTVTNAGGLTTIYNAGTGVLTLSGTSSLANYQTALESIVFSSSAADPTSGGTALMRSISWQASDGSGTSSPAVSLVNVRTPPVVTPGTPSVIFTAGGSAVTVDSGLTLSDVETGTLTSAQVSITGGFQSGDVLNFTNQNGINGSYNASTGVLTLSGSDTLAHYQAALDSITFSTSGANITSGGTDHTRTLSWQVTDNQGAVSGTASSTVTVNDPPVVTPTGVTPTYNAGGGSVILASGLTLTDHESTQLTSVTVSIGGFQAGDTLTPTNLGGLTAIYNASTGVLTLSGASSLANYQTVLESVVYSSSAADPTAGGSALIRSISWQANDGSSTSSPAISLVNVRTPPIVTAGASVTFNAGGSAVALDSGLALSDVESTTLTGATISLGSHQTGDLLNFTNQNAITGSYNASTGVLTLSGSDTLAHYQAALESITYSSSASDPTQGGTAPNRTVSWQVTDSQSATSGAATSTVAITVTASAPSIAGTSGVTATFLAGGAAAVLDGSLTISDAGITTLSGATVTITGHFLLGDTLSVSTAGTNITATWSHVHGVLSLSGTDTVANYQAVLDQITYSTTASDPSAGGSALTRTISWQVTDSRAIASTVVTTTVATAHVLPTITASGSVTFTDGDSPILADATVMVADADSNPITHAQVAITAGLAIGDTLAFNGGTNTKSFGDGSTITGSYNAVTGTLTLTAAGGNPTTADFQQALQSVTFGNSVETVGVSARTLTWTVGTADPNQTSVATTSTIALPPGPTLPPSQTFPNASTPGPSTPVPPGTSGFLFTGTSNVTPSNTGGAGPGGSIPGAFTFGTFTPSTPSTSGSGSSNPSSFDFTFNMPTFFDTGGGFDSGFGSTFTSANNQPPADPTEPTILVADGTLGIGFDQQTDKGVDQTVAAVPEKAVAAADGDTGDTGHGPVHLVIDNQRLADAGLMPSDAAPPAGKLGLSAQLRAAGRPGLLHDRQALLKSLRDGLKG
jgi:hypothetical protein